MSNRESQPLYIKNKYDVSWHDKAQCSGNFPVPTEVIESIREEKTRHFEEYLEIYRDVLQLAQEIGTQEQYRLARLEYNDMLNSKEQMCEPTLADAKDRIFFPERGRSLRYAKKICNTCPVQMHCFETALYNHDKNGVWGGSSNQDRRRIFSIAKLAKNVWRSSLGEIIEDDFDDLDDLDLEDDE